MTSYLLRGVMRRFDLFTFLGRKFHVKRWTFFISINTLSRLKAKMLDVLPIPLRTK